MAETVPDLRAVPKPEAYAELKQLAEATILGMDDEVAVMATLSSIVHHSMGYLWTGFYRVAIANELLRIGPYQGSPGCIEIKFGQGVCGAAAARGETIIVPDVAKYPGHITCDARSRSEIVIPVRNREQKLIAVLDIDSADLSRFDEQDQQGLEKISRLFEDLS
jgi:GAF domain-containing protein